MEKKSFYITAILLALLVTACSVQVTRENVAPVTPTTNLAPAEQTFDDPFAYCAAIGTIDTPDARYTGPQISDEIINGFKVAAGLQDSTEPMDMFKKTTIWRCMDSQVYACNFGANLPCSSKANIEKTPSPAMEDYCKANLNSDFIPMSVTGHSTIYSWHCVNDTPELLDQIEKVDAAGYLAQIWYPIAPNANSQPESSATPTSVPVLPSPTPAPTVTSAPIGGGSGEIVFGSNRGGSYTDIYLMVSDGSQLSRLTQGDSNSFPGPFSPDGKQIVFTGFGLTHSYVGVMNTDGSQLTDLTNQPNSDEAFPAWSPDGKQIAFTSRRDGNNEIYVMNSDGSKPTRLTNNPADDFAPAWSPDANQIAFVSDRDGKTGIYSIYIMQANGSKVTRLTDDQGIDYAPAWSPDGKKIAFRSSQEGQGDIFVVNPDGTGLVNLTNNPAEDWAPAWSPDGKWIAFQTNRDGNWEIYVMKADGSGLLNLTNNPADDQMPYWSN